MDKFLSILSKHQNIVSLVVGIGLLAYDRDLGRILITQGI